MHILLVHNPGAGAGQHDGDDLRALVTKAGHTLSYCSAKDERCAEALQEPVDLVVVAGGDGTVTRIAAEKRDRAIPFSVLPLGTANNIATTFGITGTPDEIIASWHHLHTARLNIGRMKGPWGERKFVEAVGMGALAEAMQAIHDRGTEGDRQIRQARAAFRKHLATAKPFKVKAKLDGEALPANVLLFEVMNTGRIGPALNLSRADPGDGLLDVVCLTEADRDAVLDWLDQDEPAGSAPVTTLRGRKLKLEWNGQLLRRDDDFKLNGGEGASVAFKLEPEPVRMAVPIGFQDKN